MEELSFRFRTATLEDVPRLAQLAGPSLAHPEGKARRASYRSAAQRGELLLLERYDHKARDWKVSGFIDWHMRVDDILTIRDIGTEGDPPHWLVVKQLLMELLGSLAPLEIIAKARRDASDWNETIQGIPGFELEGSEYRRPNWINVWRWTREAAAQAQRPIRGPRPRR